MLFCAPSVKKRNFFSWRFLHWSQALTVNVSCPDISWRRRPSSGVGGRWTPKWGGKPPVNTSALLKLDSTENQRQGISIKKTAWGGTTDQKWKKKKRVRLLSIWLFITAVMFLWRDRQTWKVWNIRNMTIANSNLEIIKKRTLLWHYVIVWW